MERPRTPRTFLLAAALALGGCSLTLSGPARDRPRNRPPSCDTGKGFVASDAVFGSLLVLGALVALGNDAGSTALLPGAAGAGLILAATSGNSKVNDCRTAIAAYEGDDEPEPIERRQARGQAAPRPRVAPDASLAGGAPEAGDESLDTGAPGSPRSRRARRSPAAPAGSPRAPARRPLGPAPGTAPAPAPAGTAPAPAGTAPAPAGTAPAPAPAPVGTAPAPAPAGTPPAPAPAQPQPAPPRPAGSRPAPPPPAPAPAPAPAPTPARPAPDAWVDFWKELP